MEPWSTSKPMSRVPVLWDTMAQIYQSYGASYTGEGLHLRYRELVQQAEEELGQGKTS